MSAASLFVTVGRDQGRRIELSRESIALGRDAENDFQIQDTEVSRFHAQLHRVGSGYELRDLGSSNGVFVNELRVTNHLLQSGDRIRLGRTQMIYTCVVNTPREFAGRVNIVSTNVEPLEGSHIVSTLGNSYLPAESAEFVIGPSISRAQENLQIMYRTALAVSHTLDIDQLLTRIMELIFEWVEADRGCVMLTDRGSEEWVPKVRRDRRGGESNETITISRTILEYVREKREGVLTSDARQDDRFDAARSILRMGVREAICVPMMGRYGMVGAIYIDTYTPPSRAFRDEVPRHFTDEHLKLMVAIGHQAALAVEDTTYYSAMVQSERLAAIGQTIAGLSHHIKNILQGIRGGSYLIEEGLKDSNSDVVRKGWGMVEKNQERISNLVMDMLSFSKERKPDRQPASLNSIVEEVVELMQVRAGDLSVRLNLPQLGEIPRMVFDAEGVHRAILNVVTNALDAAEQVASGQVNVATEWDHEQHVLRVVVQDNGPGIEPENIPKIFSVFESGKGNRGTGLGLPVSQKIMREHQGDILVTSEPGVGSTFTLAWPAVQPDEMSTPRDPQESDLLEPWGTEVWGEP